MAKAVLKETTKIYGGEVTISRDQWHRYWVEEKGEQFRVPGVTSCIGCLDKSAPLKQWSANEAVAECRDFILPNTTYTEEELEAVFARARLRHMRKVKEACTVGTLFHLWVHDYIVNGFWATPEMPENPQAASACEAALKYLSQHHFEPIGGSEVFLYSRQHRYAGQSDVPEVNLFAAGVIGGRRSLIDWKSSKHIYETQYRPQTAAYLEAYREQTGVDIQDRLVIRADKETGEFEPRIFKEKDQAADFQAFLNLKATYEWSKEIESRNRNGKIIVNELMELLKKQIDPFEGL